MDLLAQGAGSSCCANLWGEGDEELLVAGEARDHRRRLAAQR